MTEADPMPSKPGTGPDPVRISYIFIALMLVLVGWLHLATPLITVLFSHFALWKFLFGYRK
jgi:hypothetical protein